MIEEQSLCHHCLHQRPHNWCAEFNNDMYKVETCTKFEKTTRASNSSVPTGYVPEHDKERLLEWAWAGYQQGQISADHTDKEVFKGVVGNLMDFITGT